MRRIPRRWWRSVHTTSFAAFWLATMHLVAAGTDAADPALVLAALVAAGAVAFLTAYRLLADRRRRPQQLAPGRRVVSGRPAAAGRPQRGAVPKMGPPPLTAVSWLSHDGGMVEFLAYLSAGVLAVWGTSHTVSTLQVLAGFEPTTLDRRRVILQEWVIEAVAMWGLASLALAVTLACPALLTSTATLLVAASGV
jgi:hypothetical protein